VSRTFALSIEALPQNMRETVRVAYLLCRMVDTIEDWPKIGDEERSELFDAFEALLAQNASDAVTADSMATLCTFAQRTARVVQSTGRGGSDAGAAALAEAELLENAAAVRRRFYTLPPASQTVLRAPVLEMCSGMREYSKRRHSKLGLRIADLDDLARYCYFVAGTVGKLLTDVFLSALPGSRCRVDPETLRNLGVRFGLGLQLVNILKDIAPDLTTGVCFLPADVLEQENLRQKDILVPRFRERGLRVIHAVSVEARRHLTAAEAYLRAWPPELATAQRLFCAVPLALALGTLSMLEAGGSDVLTAGACPKVSRQFVAEVLAIAPDAASDDEALDKLFKLAGQPIA